MPYRFWGLLDSCLAAGDLANRILEKHYENWIDKGDQIKARIRFLQIMSLFSRPMQVEELIYLLNKITDNNNKRNLKEFIKPIISLIKRTDEDLNGSKEFNHKDLNKSEAFINLENDLLSLGLIVKRNPFEWETHFLVRKFFADTFPNNNDEWLSAHAILFIYFKPLPTVRLPDTHIELVPVIRAIHHGCLSKNYKAAYQLYNKQVIRGDEGFITENLGLVAWDLSILSRFEFLSKFDLDIELSDDKLLEKKLKEKIESLHKECLINTNNIIESDNISTKDVCDLLSRKAYCLELQGEFEKAKNLRKTTIGLYEIINTDFKIINTDFEQKKLASNFDLCAKHVQILTDLAHAHDKLAWLLARTESLDKAIMQAKKGFDYAKDAIVNLEKIKSEINSLCNSKNKTSNEIEEIEKIKRCIKRTEEQRYQSQATLGAFTTAMEI